MLTLQRQKLFYFCASLGIFRAQKMETTDPKQKELIEVELKKAQQSWSECSNRLAFINNEIERFTKGGEANMRIEEKQVIGSIKSPDDG